MSNFEIITMEYLFEHYPWFKELIDKSEGLHRGAFVVASQVMNDISANKGDACLSLCVLVAHMNAFLTSFYDGYKKYKQDHPEDPTTVEDLLKSIDEFNNLLMETVAANRSPFSSN